MPDYTYRQVLGSLKNTAQREPEARVLAQMMALSLHMQWDGGPSAKCDFDSIDRTANKLMKQKGFKELMKDPLALKLAQGGKHLELMQLLDVKEGEIRKSREDYERPSGIGDLKNDAEFLKDAADALKNGSAKGRPAELEKKSPRYQEMIKQIEAAQLKVQGGVQITSGENHNLINAVKDYIEGGSKVAGGVKKAPHFKEAMCVLKEYMPADEFRKYCNRINEAHPKRKVDPNSFIYERMVSQVKTATEIRKEAKLKLAAGFSESACAEIVAAKNLSKGNVNALITPEALEREKARLLEKGSAFRRAMTDPKEREEFKKLAASGKSVELGNQISKSAKQHAIGSMQWIMNRSIRMLTEGPVNRHMSAEGLASIYVAHEKASRIGPGTTIDAKSFNHEKEAALKDPSFRKFVQRYNNDPEFKKRIDKDLKLDGTGSIVALEVHKIKNPQAQRQMQQEQIQNQLRQPRQPEDPHIEPPVRQGPIPS